MCVSVNGYGWVAILGITRGDPCFLLFYKKVLHNFTKSV
nr:MAG TPA: hypothetical protein [Caudoviricetes sp.]